MARLSYIVAIISIALTYVVAQELYTDKYDDVDVIQILENEKLRDQYYKCFMEQGPCLTGDAKFLREILSEAFQTKCKKCTEKQKVMLDQIVDWYTTNAPDEWRTIVEKTVEDMKKMNANK
nr:PREDICTED: ejaculatory bulb-specific protein 3-like [Linepithema humile]